MWGRNHCAILNKFADKGVKAFKEEVFTKGRKLKWSHKVQQRLNGATFLIMSVQFLHKVASSNSLSSKAHQRLIQRKGVTRHKHDCTDQAIMVQQCHSMSLFVSLLPLKAQHKQACIWEFKRTPKTARVELKGERKKLTNYLFTLCL